jgi:heme exporter protein A
MVQRLTIARATLHNPDILLLDEPYTGLDEQATRLLDALLLREREAGRTILLITHDLLRGLELADRVAILHRGRIVREVSRDGWTGEQFLALYRETVGA